MTEEEIFSMYALICLMNGLFFRLFIYKRKCELFSSPGYFYSYIVLHVIQNLHRDSGVGWKSMQDHGEMPIKTKKSQCLQHHRKWNLQAVRFG